MSKQIGVKRTGGLPYMGIMEEVHAAQERSYAKAQAEKPVAATVTHRTRKLAVYQVVYSTAKVSHAPTATGVRNGMNRAARKAAMH
jgi:hypothetical protein